MFLQVFFSALDFLHFFYYLNPSKVAVFNLLGQVIRMQPQVSI